MPVLISGFCTAISDRTGYLDMNSAMLAKVEKNHSEINYRKGPIELSFLMGAGTNSISS